MSVNVTSEIGRLRSVLVHTPGPELLAVTPDTREDYLYDDIIDADAANREHRRFLAVVERFASVLQVRDLLADILETPDVRDFVVRETMNIVPSEPLERELLELPTLQLVDRLIEGREEPQGPLALTLNECSYALPPLPNLFFTRDSAMSIGRHVLVGSMRYAVRWTEELLMKVLFRSHPALANSGILYDGSVERRHNYSLEGGDVHPIRSDTVMIGFSERSSPSAIDTLTELLFRETPIEHVIVVVMPKENTAIHLDMIFTQVDHGHAVVFPPHFVGSERLSVLYWKKGQSKLREMPSVFRALEAVGLPMEPIFCGGQRRIEQEREQWASGCNFVALRPGLVMSYERNQATLREMEQFGYKVVSAEDFLTGGATIPESQRAIITFAGAELVRAGGGPRCMSCPIERDEAWG